MSKRSAIDLQNPGLMLGRRRFLELSASASMLLSPVVRNRIAEAQGAFPKRVIFLVTGLGHDKDAWGAEGSENDFKLKEILQGLEKFKNKMIVTSGLNQTCVSGQEGHHHERSILTNAPGPRNVEGDLTTAHGASIDQLIAAQVGTKTKLRNLEFAYGTYQNGKPYCSPCYSGPGQQIALSEDIGGIFDRVFNGVDPKSKPAMMNSNEPKRAALNKSILDNITADLNTVKKELTGNELSKLDAHLTAIRGLEQRIQASTGTVGQGGCYIPTRVSGDMSGSKFIDVAKVHSDLITATLSCDVTRIITVQWGMEGSHGGPNGKWPDAPIYSDGGDNCHWASHWKQDPQAGYTRQNYIDLSKLKTQAVLGLCNMLSAIPEGAGTMLDNTSILWTSAIQEGTHYSDNLPAVIIGNCGGYFSSGRYLTYNNENHARLLLSMAESVGANIPEIGDSNDYKATSPLPRVRG